MKSMDASVGDILSYHSTGAFWTVSTGHLEIVFCRGQQADHVRIKKIGPSGEQGISGFMTYSFCVFSVLLFGREAPTYCYVANSYILARLETERFWIIVLRW
jgi:hypothetical protein